MNTMKSSPYNNCIRFAEDASFVFQFAESEDGPKKAQ